MLNKYLTNDKLMAELMNPSPCVNVKNPVLDLMLLIF